MKTSSQSLLTNKSETENGQTNYVMTAMRRPLLAFAVGFLLGNFVFTVLTYLTGDTLSRKLFVLVKNPPPLNDDGGLDITHKIVYRDSNKFKVESPVDFDVDLKDHHYHPSLNKEALKEQQEIRILCWVLTSPDKLPIKGKPVNDSRSV